MWRWESTKPGITIMPEASITSASAATSPGPTWAISPRSMSTSAVVKSPTSGSRLSTVPPRITIRSVGTTRKSGPEP